MLAAGYVVFWIGAALWSLDFQQDSLAETLRSVADQKFRWAWTNVFMGAGPLITAVGYRWWSDYQAQQGGTTATSSIGAMLYTTGAVLWMAEMALRLSVTVTAANGASAGYAAFDQLANGLGAAYLFLSHAATVIIAFGLLRSPSGSRVVGVIGLGLGAFLGIGLAIGPGYKQVFMAPFLGGLFSALLAGYLFVQHRRSLKAAA